MTPSSATSAVVLLSGGLDSATTLAEARATGAAVHALTVDYGQRHRAELACASRLAAAMGARSHRVVRVDLGSLGGSALTTDAPVPKGRSDEAIAHGIPITYVPGRNTVFLAVAVAAAEALDADDVWIGVNAIDFSGYPDCGPAFLEAFRAAAALGTRRGVEGRPIGIRAPLLALRKADIVRRAVALGVPLAETLSCYDPVTERGRAVACGACDACVLRARGFDEAGVVDPAPRASAGV
jgi:7-cyano-7-deazaguanine synthase